MSTHGKIAAWALALYACAWALCPRLVAADSVATVELVYTNRRFTPQKVAVPAGKPVVVRVRNLSSEAIEFESFSLNREKVVPPGETITVKLPPLTAGTYDFYDDFHQDVPQGSFEVR